MKSFISLMGSAAVVALATGRVFAADLPAEQFAPAQQPPQISGTVEIYGIYVDADGDGDDFTAWGLGGGGHVYVPFGDSYGLQIDAVGEGAVDGDENEGDDYSGFTGAGHLIWRNPDQYAFGVVGALSANSGESAGAIHGLIGVEAQAYFGMFTLFGQGGFISDLEKNNSDGLEDTWFVRGGGRWFPNPDLKLELNGGYYDGEYDGGDDYDAWGVGAEGEWMISSPMSVFANYEGFFYEDQWGDDFDSHTIMVGGRWYFNTQDLLSRDRNADSFDLPDITRIHGIMDDLN